MKWTKYTINFLLLINFNLKFIFCIIIIVHILCGPAWAWSRVYIISVHGSII